MRIHGLRMNRVAVGRFFIGYALAAVAVGCFALTGYAQSEEGQIIPNRGFHPTGSYALGNIETINTTNGNLMLDIPLGSLPPGRGGSPGFQLRLRYNSKIWDGQADMAENPNNPNQMVDVTWLVKSDEGGWNYNLRPFSWSVYNRNSGGVVYPEPDCRHFNIWKMKVTFPDGGTREFRPYGHDDQCDDNYFRVQPAPGMSYYSVDGTYARLDLAANGWTLYFGDGTRVVDQSGWQRTYDRNGNYTEIQSVADYNNTGHPAIKIIDQLGRSIAIEHAFGEDYIHVGGVNGETVTTTVKFSPTFVKKTYRAGNHFQYDVNINNWGVSGVSEIILPSQLGSNLKYLFGYNGWPTTGNTTPSVGWGELSSITLPSGATANYQYEMDNQSGSLLQANWVLANVPTRKDLNYNLEYDGVTTSAPAETWLYGIGESSAQIIAPDGGITNESFGSTAAQAWNRGLVYKSERPDGTVIERLWKENRPYLPPGVTIHGSLGVNARVEKEFVSIRNAAGVLDKTAIKEYRHDKNGNLTQQSDYDWIPYLSVPRDGSGNPTGMLGGAQLKRLKTNSYYSATPDALDTTTNDPDSYDKTSAPRIRTAVASSEGGDGLQTLARSEFFYDDALTTGNLTQQKSWDSTKGILTNPLTSGNSISVSHQYDVFGNATLSTDARGFQTEFLYGLVGGVTNLYPTQIKTAFQTAAQRTATQEYDFNTGLVTRITDADNNVSTLTTYDDLGRPTLLRGAEGKPEEARTATEYSAANRRVIVRLDLNTVGDGKLVSIQHYDQLGRIRLSRQLEDATNQSAVDETTGIKVQTRYVVSNPCQPENTPECLSANASSLGSYQLVSNPYRAAYSSSVSGEATMGWTWSKADKGGRVISVQTFAGPGLPAPWGTNVASTGTVVTAYDAEFTTVTDQAGKVRRSMTNGLGQLARVDEPNATNNLGSTTSPAQPTTYSYDALGNLRLVTQESQQRFFMYDSLSRLWRARNPEQDGNTNLSLTDSVTGNSQWSFAYSYDNNGNLLSKTDARNVVSNYVYDALNRITSRSYQNDPTGTPAVTYSYDPNIANGKGRLASVSSSVSTYSYSAYDAMGRVKDGSQTIGSQVYPISCNYDLAGHVKSMAYPSGRIVSYSYDNAGRLNKFTGNLGEVNDRDYATNMTYSSLGGMTEEKYGTTTPLYNKRHYNVRGQLFDNRLSTVSWATDEWAWDRGAILNWYDANTSSFENRQNSGPDNNGNVRRSQSYTVLPGGEQAYYTDDYAYDSLNRLESINAFRSGAHQFIQAYIYDRYGNRTINDDQPYAGINKKQFTVNTANNRLGVGVGQSGTMTYDNAGNLTTDIIQRLGFDAGVRR